MSNAYLALRDLLAQPPYAAMSDADAAEALNTPSIATPGDPMVTPDEFVSRFTADEFAAARDSADARVRQLMFRLAVRREPLSLTSDTVTQGLGYMAVIGLLTPARAVEIAAVPAGPMISPARSLGWPEATIWPADVTAARAMEG